MNKKAKKIVVPKLRFPEFQNQDTWSIQELNELLTENKQKNRDLKYGPEEVLSVSGEFGCVNQIKLLGRSYAGASVKDYHLVNPGDIVYTKSPLKKNPFGIIKANKGSAGIVSTLYAVYSPTKICNPSYLDYYFSDDYKLNSFLQPIVRKGPKNTIMVNNEAVLTGKIVVPNLEEQQKISTFFSLLDDLLAAQIDKVAVLKRYKKGLLHQLFLQDEETVPRLRFPQFQSDPPWVTKTLQELATITSGGTPSRTKKEYWNGKIPWVTTTLINFNTIFSANEYITELGLENSSAKVFPKGTILMAMYGQGVTRGRVGVLGIDAATNQACAAILLKESLDSSFLFQNLAGRYDEIRKMSNSGGQENLSGELIKGIRVSYPENPLEQKKIAEVLSSLDLLIYESEEDVGLLRLHRQGLLEQVIPLLSEVVDE